MMRFRFYRQFFGAVVMMSLWQLASWAVSPDDFNKITFVNNLSSGNNIEYLFYSPSDSQYWGPDVLEKHHYLTRDKKNAFFVFYPDSTAKFDFMAVDSDGRIYEIDSIEITDSKERTVTITDRHATAKTIERMPMTEIMVVNNTGTNLDFVFFAPADSKIWGLEMLNTGRTLRIGEESSFVVLLSGERFEMEFLALGEDGREYQKTLSIGSSSAPLFMEISDKDLIKQ